MTDHDSEDARPDTTPPERPGHPGLTIRVYRVDQATRERRDVGPAQRLGPARSPVFTMAWPPCACPLCRSCP
ncbi:hypothetical protein [Actinacidiphila yeochonensis]|uniref:hypothetical protein n=1 Tax=Actinacidiphila yeochonensis TaxID=89050 RepID=UPI0012FF19F1|nr:hypothetical protein [Actinacidiphila yeochonensis]